MNLFYTPNELIVSEGAIAAGIRRIEAITGPKVEEYFYEQQQTLHKLRELLNNPADVVKLNQHCMKFTLLIK